MDGKVFFFLIKKDKVIDDEENFGSGDVKTLKKPNESQLTDEKHLKHSLFFHHHQNHHYYYSATVLVNDGDR